jgi:DNA polymerase-3 subunit delta
VAVRDAAGAIAVLPHVLAQPKTSAVTIIMALTTQTLALAYAVASGKRSAGDFFALLKDTGAFPGRAWGEAVNAWVRAVPAWNLAALEGGIARLLAADVALKESRVSDDEQVLVSLILDLCAS